MSLQMLEDLEIDENTMVYLLSDKRPSKRIPYKR